MARKLSKLTVERLRFGANLLLRHHDNGVRFNLETWCIRGDVRAADWCGTTACACGLFGLHPWFNMRGLFTDYGEVVLRNYDTGQLVCTSWDAITNFFGIPNRLALFLFSSMAYRDFDLPHEGDEGAKVVAERIKALLRAGEVPLKYRRHYGHGGLRA